MANAQTASLMPVGASPRRDSLRLTRSDWMSCNMDSSSERLQAINDFGVFGAQALASLSAGTTLVLVGWDALNLAALPLLAWVAITVLVRRTALSGTAQRPAVA